MNTDYLLLLSSIVLGVVSVYVFRLHEPKHVKLLNAFTGAYLLCLTVLHLLPELYVHEGAPQHAEIRIGIMILIGFFAQVALDAVSLGVEHGHSHHVHGRMPVGIVGGFIPASLISARDQPTSNVTVRAAATIKEGDAHARRFEIRARRLPGEAAERANHVRLVEIAARQGSLQPRTPRTGT